jgi:hypothetical protein
MNHMDLLDNDDDENKENVESALTVYGTNVKVEKNTVVIFNHKNKSGQDFKKEADLIIEYLISEGYVNKKKFKVKIITTSL